MKTEEINYMINLYFDGELEKNKEPILFTHLSQDELCREYFKNMNVLKSSQQVDIKEFPNELDSRILNSIGDVEQKKSTDLFSRNFFAFASISFAAVLLIVTLFFYSEAKNYKQQLNITAEQITQQGKLIQLLYNTMPAAEIVGNYENQIIIKAKM